MDTQMSGVQMPATQPPAHGNVPPARQSKKWIIALLVVVIIAAGGGVYFFSQLKNQAPVGPLKGFALEPKQSDSAGIDPATSFVLYSEHEISAEKIKEIVHFSPNVDFNITKLAQAPRLLRSLVHVVLAKGVGAGAAVSYELKPATQLQTNTIYKISLASSDVVDHEYSWAFQVKAPFQVISSNPRHQATYVPTNTGIEITFNREDFLDPQDYFSIEPKVDGTFEQHGDTFVFLPKKLEDKKIYKVTVKKGMSTRGSGDTLTEDYTFAFETGDQQYQGAAAQFDLNDSFVEFVPDKKTVFTVSSYNFDTSKLQATVYQFANDTDFVDSYRKSRQWEFWWSYFYRIETATPYDPSGLQKIVTFSPVIQQSNYINYFEVPQSLPVGYYLMDIVFEGKHRQAWLEVNPLAHYFSISHDNGIFWLYDFPKKAPVANAHVDFVGTSNATLGSTDSTGLVQFTTPESLQGENRDAAGPQFFKVTADGYQPLITRIVDNWGYQQRAYQGDKFWQFLSSDRYTYMVSDAVKYWGVVKGRTTDMREKKVSVGIYPSTYAIDFGPQGYGSRYFGPEVNDETKPVVTQDVMISNFDTIQGELSYQGLAPGTYSLLVKSGNDLISSQTFEVLSYTKPAYQITVSSDKQALFAGDEVTFKVKANFFDTTPVAGLQLNYNAYWNSSLTGKVTLDDNGEGSLKLKPEYRESDGDYYPRQFTISFSPVLSEEGEIYGNASALVFGPHMYLQAYSKNKPGTSTHTFSAKLNDIVTGSITNTDSYFNSNDYIGKPVANYPLTATIKKITYNAIETGQYYDPINKIVQKIYDYKPTESIVETISGTTSATGEWSFDRDLPKKTNEWFEVSFTGKDHEGRALKSVTYPYEYQPYYGSSNGGGAGFAVQLNFVNKPVEAEFSVGDTVNLEMQVQEGAVPNPTQVLFYRYQNKIDKTLVASGLTYQETFAKEFIPSVQYRAVIFGPYGFVQTNEVVASFKDSDNQLSIDVQTDKPQYRPGDTINVALAVTDKDKKPVSAEVNISAVDEALFHILPMNFQPQILPTLLHNIYIALLTGSSEYRSLDQKLAGAPGGAEFGGCFTGDTPVMMAGNVSKPIADIKVGDMVMTRATEQSSSRVGAIVQGVSQHFVDDLIVINHSLEVTPEHELFVNGIWQYAGLVQVGDTLIGTDGRAKKVISVEQKHKPHTAVYNIVVGTYHTYFAGSYYVHNAEKGGSPRANFVDVPLYKSVHTDDKGMASLQFKAPDNITSWRITSMAYDSANLRAGQTTALVPTTLPFFVDSTLNATYLAGDSPSVRLRAFGTNAAPKDKKTTFEVKSDDLKLDSKQDVLANNAYLSIGALPEGEYPLTLSAQQAENKDSMIRKIQVLKNYFRIGETSEYTVADTLTGIQGNKNGFTDLVFMDKGRGRFYSALKSQTYWTGIRSDQQAGDYFSQKLLAQYFKDDEPAEQLDLSRYQTEEGAVSLFPYSDSDIELTAKIADLAPDFIYQDKVKQYLKASLEDKKADIHRIAKAVYGLASLQEPVLPRVQVLQGSSDLTLEDTLYVALALAKFGDQENARSLYTNKIKPQLRFEGGQAWLAQEQDNTKQVKWTSMIGVLASYIHEQSDAAQLWEYMNTHSPERDLNILEKTLFMKSELPKTADITASFTYTTSGVAVPVKLEKGALATLTLSSEDLAAIKFSDVVGDIAVVSFYERSQDAQELTRNPELAMTRQYLVNNKQTLDFKEGDLVKVRLTPTIAKSALDGSYQVVDFLPSGLKPIMQLYEKGYTDETQGDQCNPTWYPTKIVGQTIYFTVYKGFSEPFAGCKTRTLNYYARVVSRGEFTANPALIQSALDIRSLNISDEQKIKIAP